MSDRSDSQRATILQQFECNDTILNQFHMSSIFLDVARALSLVALYVGWVQPSMSFQA